jgi:hypothetical protein
MSVHCINRYFKRTRSLLLFSNTCSDYIGVLYGDFLFSLFFFFFFSNIVKSNRIVIQYFSDAMSNIIAILIDKTKQKMLNQEISIILFVPCVA